MKLIGIVKGSFIEKFLICFRTILLIGILIFTTMKIKKSQLENLIKEAVEAQVGPLNEEELEELFGGLKNLFGTGAKAVGSAAQRAGSAVGNVAQKAGSAVAGAAKGAGQAVAGQASRVGQAVSGAAAGAAGAVKGAYAQGEKTAAMASVKKSIQGVLSTIASALPKVTSDEDATDQLLNIKAAVDGANSALAESLAKRAASPSESKPRSIQEKRSSHPSSSKKK